MHHCDPVVQNREVWAPALVSAATLDLLGCAWTTAATMVIPTTSPTAIEFLINCILVSSDGAVQDSSSEVLQGEADLASVEAIGPAPENRSTTVA
jgi:hypothetical protein